MHEVGNKPAFHRLDLFHTMQLGQGKAFSASALVTLMPLFDGTSVDAKLASMTQQYKQYCKVTCLLYFFRRIWASTVSGSKCF